MTTYAKVGAVSGGVIALAVVTVCLFKAASGSSRAYATPATETIKGQFFTTGQLVDAGNATPEAALESSFWAAATGNYDAIADFYVPELRDEARNGHSDRSRFAAEAQSKFASFKGLQILARKEVAENKVELKYRFGFQNTRPGQTGDMVKIALLVKTGDAWRCAQTSRYEPGWDAGTQPEPQP
jgi:hypothetical protein